MTRPTRRSPEAAGTDLEWTILPALCVLATQNFGANHKQPLACLERLRIVPHICCTVIIILINYMLHSYHHIDKLYLYFIAAV